MGTIRTTHDGQVIESVVGGPLDIRHDNVTIRNCTIVTDSSDD